MNKLQKMRYNKAVLGFSKFWMILTTILSLVLSVWVVSKFRADDGNSLNGVIMVGIIYCITWILVYMSGIVWIQDSTYKRVTNTGF